MKAFKYIIMAVLPLAALALTACDDNEQTEAKAVLASASSLTFTAENPSEQIITVYSDADWTASCDDWVSVDPTSGYAGSTDVAVTVTENVRSGAVDNPRTGSVVFQGSAKFAGATVAISQEGDKFRDVEEYTVTQAAAADDGTVIIIPSAQVVAITTDGFVISDGSTNMFVTADPDEVTLGCEVLVGGDKGSLRDLPVMESADSLVYVAMGTLSYPTATDISGQAATYAASATAMEYISFYGYMTSSSIATVDDELSVQIYNAPSDFGLSDLSKHYVTLSGYYFGTDGTYGYFILTDLVDEGISVVFNEGFPVEWEAASNDYPDWPATGGTSGGGIASVTGTGTINFYFVDQTVSRTKSILDVSGNNPRVNGVWDGDYLEFTTSNSVTAGRAVQIEYECRISAQGARYWRLVYLDGEEWQPVMETTTIEVDGYTVEYNVDLYPGGSADDYNQVVSEIATYTNDTYDVTFRFICAGPINASTNTAWSAPTSASFRLDCSDANAVQPSLTLMSEGYVAPTTANIEVGGLTDDTMTFAAIPSESQSFTVTSDQSFTIAADDDWISIDNTSGSAGETVTVAVTCSANGESDERTGTITISSGSSTYTVTVVQEAVAQELDPLVSIVGGNYATVDYGGGDISVTVQANVDVSAEVTDGTDWLTVTDNNTKAAVEYYYFTVTAAENDESSSREGKVRFYNEEYGLETILTVTQDAAPVYLYAEWLFTADTYSSGVHSAFNTAAGDETKQEGTGGAYVYSNVSGTGYIYYYSVDKTEIDTSNKFARIIGTTGHPYVTGAWPGDYWLFTAEDGTEYPAGTQLHISFVTRLSGTGQKYWMLEYWDGAEWQPALETETVEVSGETVEYNFTPATSTPNSSVDVTYTLATACTLQQFRYRCMANYTASDSVLSAPNGGTCRIAGADDGTSPVFEVVSE